MSSISATGRSFKLALIQLSVGANKAANLSRAVQKVEEAAKKGAQVISLPECFNSPYGTKYFPEYAESITDGPTCKALKEAAEKHKVYLIGGSFPERQIIDGKENLYNTSTVWSPEGNLIGEFRKLHLFDIDIPNKITFRESDALTAGNSLTVVETPFCKIGLGICYDIRFPDIAQIYSRKHGCELLVYPGAFNMTTGPAHWDLLAKARAVDNQVFVATVSPARDESADYIAWGHSTIVDPFASVVSSAAGGEEEIVYADIDLDHLKTIRGQIPVTVQRRQDLIDGQALINQSIKKEDKLVKEIMSISEVFKEKKQIAFCRCWKSAKWPNCDGAHKQHNKETGDNIGPLVIKKDDI